MLPRQTCLASSGGYEIIQEGDIVTFVNRQTSLFITFEFVASLVGFILLVNGIFQMFFSPLLGAMLFVLGLMFAFVFYLAQKIVQKRKGLPLDQARRTFIIDLAKQIALDPDTKKSIPLSTLSFSKVFQIFSSSRAIRAQWHDGSKIILRPNPFSFAGSGSFIRILKDLGLWKDTR